MPQDPQPGVTHPEFDDQHDNFWHPDWAPNFDDVPAFIKNSVDMSKVQQKLTPPEKGNEGQYIADVDDAKPYTVNVMSDEVKNYNKDVLNHEITHSFQFTRDKALSPVKVYDSKSGVAGYDYGKLEGLQNAIKNRKTIADFNDEQQAEIVMDYKKLQDDYLAKAKRGEATPEDERKFYQIQQAYHPFIKQLADMPDKQHSVGRSAILEILGKQQPATINTKPEPPGLPSYDTPGLGVMVRDKLLGGRSQSTVPLSEQDKGYKNWLTKNHLREDPTYDMYGAYKAGLQPAKNGHMSDEYKKPNHPTYSDESIYSKKPGAPQAGTWVKGKQGKWTFEATPTNIQNAGGVEGLKSYFDTVEPGNTVIFPNGEIYVGGSRIKHKNLSSGLSKKK